MKIMKIKNLIKVFLLIMIVCFTIVSCKKSAFDINANPNNATDSTVAYNVILPAALNNTGRIVATRWSTLQNYLSFWARSGTYAPASDEESYNVTPTSGPVGGLWTALYDNLYDYEVMETKSKIAGADFYTGIAKIMKAHNFAILVDVFGNVPYSAALKGNGNITPSYDKGIDIYKDLLIQIDLGATLIKNASNSITGPNKNIATDDIMFSTPTTSITTANIDAQKPKWARFANTLKLRLLVHLMNGGVKFPVGSTNIAVPESVVPGINIPSEIAKITATGSGYLIPGQNAEVNPGYRADKPNPFYNSYVRDVAGTVTANSEYFKANEVGLTLYSDNADPRIDRFYEAGALGLKGVLYGLPSVTANSAANLAGIGPGVYKGNDKSQWIMTATEGLLLQAEATHRGFLPGGATAAQSLMANGIQESFNMLGVPATSTASAYIINNGGYADVDYFASVPGPGVSPNAPIGGLYTIISQKWLALNAIAPYEVWTDYRRVDYSTTIKNFRYGIGGGHQTVPQISVSPSNTKTEIPIRYPYPQDEYNYNAASVLAQGSINIFTSKIFWDLN
jgi:hypothetical protein